MKNSFVVTVGDLVIADFLDSIYIMALATCVSFISVNFIQKKVLATHFLRPDINPNDKSKNVLAYVYPGILVAIDEFEKATFTPISYCQNYLVGGISKDFSQFAGETGDLNVQTARAILKNKHIYFNEFVGGQFPKTVIIEDGIVTVKINE